MLPLPPGDGRWSAQQQKLALAFVVLLLPWLQLVDARQKQPSPPERFVSVPDKGSHSLPDQHAGYKGNGPNIDGTFRGSGLGHDTPIIPLKTRPRQQHTDQQDDEDTPSENVKRYQWFEKQGSRNHYKHDSNAYNINKRNIKSDDIPNDASAVATYALAQSVRAPLPRHPWSTSAPASGLASPHNLRSLGDWEVEDFVLLATVDGDLYASDRKTGKERWHLEVDQPMVETKHFRGNNSVLNADYNPVDHYIWAVEPSNDGAIYIWIPDESVGMVRTSFTMKQIVEKAPHANDDPPVVYTGDKKTTMFTLDAATGRVLKWFGTGGSHVNQAESCIKPSALYDADAEECSSTNTITLGRTEYTVGIQRKDGKGPIATLKYSEWGPNNFDSDLAAQYRTSLDSHYITSQHDGKVYILDYGTSERPHALSTHKFPTPVARVLDVCRPSGTPPDSSRELVVLPQPPMPAHGREELEIQTNSIFLNQTESGSWFAMSGLSYPLIVGAPPARASRPEWQDIASRLDKIDSDRVSHALIGTHHLDSRMNLPDSLTLPAGNQIAGSTPNYPAGTDPLPLPSEPDSPTLITKVRDLPQRAANSVIDFISNPTLIIVFFVALAYNESSLALHRRGPLVLDGRTSPRGWTKSTAIGYRVH
jgi:serine/threonine-protein kinase/endoribonuclease IRE1